jgi:hypothetical protein
MKKKIIVIFLIFAAVVPLFYAFYTGHIWEDYFITFKFSKNLVEGKGLVYNEGMKVHGFTSPLGTLLPAFCYWIGGSDKSAIWLFRILFCIPAFVGGGYFLVKILEKIFPGKILPAALCLFMYLVEAKSVMFSVNGMETAFMIFFLSWMCSIAVGGRLREKWFQLGISWAGLMWTRPDSCVYVAAFALSSLVFIDVPRKSQIRVFLKSALVCTLLYMPWFVWAWSYYGSPVPHTVSAKGMPISSLSEFIFMMLNGLKDLSIIPGWAYFPVYPHFGPWPYSFIVFSLFAFRLYCF